MATENICWLAHKTATDMASVANQPRDCPVCWKLVTIAAALTAWPVLFACNSGDFSMLETYILNILMLINAMHMPKWGGHQDMEARAEEDFVAGMNPPSVGRTEGIT